jgi:tetratricopeptide (TPR) repeat protein
MYCKPATATPRMLITAMVISLLLSGSVYSQKAKVDSLLKELQATNADTTKVRLLWTIARDMNKYNPDSALLLAQQGLYLARNTSDLEGESRSLGILANTFMKIGNYPRALELNLEKLKLEEKRKVSRNLASVLMNIGIVYALQEEYREALKYYSKADSVIVKDSVNDFRFNINLNIGDTYNRLNVSDSAYLFFNKSLQYAREAGNGENTGIAMTGLGHSFLKLSSTDLSRQNYKDALAYLEAANNDEIYSEAALGLASLYEKLSRWDSAEYFAKLSLYKARLGKFNSAELQAVEFLSQHYQQRRRYDSAFVFSGYLKKLNDSVNSKTRIRESQIITTNEHFRQAELEEVKKQEKKKRIQQLQLLLIGIFIPAIFLLTLILSRAHMHPRIVRLLGVISLLFLFEYLTLLLHPVVAEITHHTPVLEILIFVGVAALVIPLHHKLEHWMIHKLSHWHQRHPHKAAPVTEPEQKEPPEK